MFFIATWSPSLAVKTLGVVGPSTDEEPKRALNFGSKESSQKFKHTFDNADVCFFWKLTPAHVQVRLGLLLMEGLSAEGSLPMSTGTCGSSMSVSLRLCVHLGLRPDIVSMETIVGEVCKGQTDKVGMLFAVLAAVISSRRPSQEGCCADCSANGTWDLDVAQWPHKISAYAANEARKDFHCSSFM